MLPLCCLDQEWVPCPDCPRNYEYQIGSFSKWKETFALEVDLDSAGEWTNVTKYLSWDGEGVTHDWYYFDSRIIFTDEVLSAWQEDLGVTVGIDEVTVEGYDNVDCSGTGSCLDNICWCQVLTDNDCYCNFGNTAFADSNVTVYGFAQRHNCEGATLRNGAINLLSVVLFIIGALAIRARQNSLEVYFDEDEQTAQDYSICVLNPPADAHDPDEWKSFFENNFDCHVTVCTVDVDNDWLVNLLARRREILEIFELTLPGVEITEENLEAEAEKSKESEGFMNMLGLAKSTNQLYAEYKTVCENISKEVHREFRGTSSVFVTFETEAGQREVLNWLTVGSVNARKNNLEAVDDPRHLFRGKHVLHVVEPEEPSNIRWQEMDASTKTIMIKLLITSFICLVLIAIAFSVITWLYTFAVWLAPIATTFFTSTFPMLAKSLMNMERHRSESARQKWLFIKIASFNILVTSVLLSVVQPFTATLDDREESLPGLIPSVHALFFSQLLLTPAMQLSDYMGHINRHIFAPRAKTQVEMNRMFTGAQIFLAERYANLMKYLYLVVWYCAIYPAGFFMGSVALIIVYFVDRFSLMRSWARTPQLGTQISDFARNYFTPAALVLMAVFSAYAWSGFPYDNLCVDENELPQNYLGQWDIYVPGSEKTFLGSTIFKAPDVDTSINISAGDVAYKFCLQDFRAYLGDPSFPPLPRFQIDQWMTDDQEKLLDVYGWFAVAVLAAVVVTFVTRIGLNIYRSYVGAYASRGGDMGVSFSSIKSIDTYVPFFQPTHGYPFLLCDVSEIDPNLFSWTDPDKPHEAYDVTKDIVKVVGDEYKPKAYLFAQVKYWKPPAKAES